MIILANDGPRSKPITPAFRAAHPLAVGLAYSLTLTEGHGDPCDLIRGDAATRTGAPTWDREDFGPSLIYPQAGPNHHALPGRIAAAAWTVAAYCRPDGALTDHDRQPILTTTGNYGIYLTVGSGGPSLFTQAFTWLDGAGGAEVGRWTMIAASGSVSGRAVYAGGILRGADSDSGAGFALSTGALVGYRADSGAGDNQYNGRIAAVHIWHRVLSAREHAELADDPFFPIRTRRLTPFSIPLFPEAAVSMAGSLGLTGAAAFQTTGDASAIFADRPQFNRPIDCEPRFLIS